MSKKSYRMMVASTASAALVASAFVPAASANAEQFTDVSERYMDAVSFLVEIGATNGVSPSQFGTNMPITRVDAAILLANVLDLDTEGAEASGFTDVPSRGVGAVNALKEAGITNGKTATSFASYQTITRGELAIWLQNGFGLEGSSELEFTDVNERYQEAVEALVANEITNGISSTQFGVNNPAKRGDYAIFLHNAVLSFEVEPFDLSIMHTNDTHGNLDQIAKMATAVQDYRDWNPEALLLDAGDT